MKILVVIANHGTKNDGFARQLIDSYRSMDHDVDIIALSNIEKDWGPEIEVRVGAPTPDPWSLPFAHKQIFADRLEEGIEVDPTRTVGSRVGEVSLE